ncbi:hypothetical protein NOI87_34780, partial [Neorhizobium galegae]|uniref:hypothetical protein n=1 Tax=Neorhizobium galegae TaxID=399 RepID=UPI0021073F99
CISYPEEFGLSSFTIPRKTQICHRRERRKRFKSPLWCGGAGEAMESYFNVLERSSVSSVTNSYPEPTEVRLPRLWLGLASFWIFRGT